MPSKRIAECTGKMILVNGTEYQIRQFSYNSGSNVNLTFNDFLDHNPTYSQQKSTLLDIGFGPIAFYKLEGDPSYFLCLRSQPKETDIVVEKYRGPTSVYAENQDDYNHIRLGIFCNLRNLKGLADNMPSWKIFSQTGVVNMEYERWVGSDSYYSTTRTHVYQLSYGYMEDPKKMLSEGTTLGTYINQRQLENEESKTVVSNGIPTETLSHTDPDSGVVIFLAYRLLRSTPPIKMSSYTDPNSGVMTFHVYG